MCTAMNKAMERAMISDIDKIASSVRFHLQIQNVSNAGIHGYAHEVYKMAKRGYSHENLKCQISGLQINGMEQPLDLVTSDKVATLALEVVAAS
jgi:hypothetical protein